MTVLEFCFLIGCIAGLRALTAPAVVCWGAYLGWLHFADTRLAFIGHPITLGIFTLLAVLEIVNDKLPMTPARVEPSGLIPRILLGGCCGAAFFVSAGGGGLILGIVAGVVGALVAAFVGYRIRRVLVKSVNLSDLPVALVEDAIAIGGGLLIVSHLV